MPNLRLFTSNRLEILADELAKVTRIPLSSPFQKEVIVVQSKGMERWISMAIAERHGVCANMEFPFPNAFINDVLKKAFPELTGGQPYFNPEIMTWRIMEILPSLVSKPGFESLRIYLEGEEGGLKLFQLSERIADTFDQYLLFRPEMMLKWDRGEADLWQAVLWRELAEGHKTRHRAALGKAFVERLKKSSSELEGLPERVSVFGISTLPRFYIQVFSSISRFTPVNLFLMNPCMEYWGDIASGWEIKRAADKGQLNLFRAEDLHLEKGNSLLVSTGTLGREFFDIINEFDCEDIQSFEDPGENSLLTSIQSDILNLRERNGDLAEKTTIPEDDTSIQIHSCHSPMRDVEVLHDNLLKMFETDPELRPKDILVMTPDIEAYAPYIQAVFDIPVGDRARIPFSIADQSVKKEGRIIETFLAITRIGEGRFSAFQVMGILESKPVQQRFDLSESDVELIRNWIEKAWIRWGIDGAYRSEIGLPDISENTWKAGLDRLLLGYAMQGREEHMFAGVLPFDNMEGSETTVLGNFLEFTEQLFSQVKILKQSQTLEEWSVTLEGLLETFFLPQEEIEQESQIIRHILNDLSEEQRISGFNERVDIAVIRCLLEQRLEKEGFGFGFISGNVTFCAMLPMRSIPFKVICLMGMNSDAYPRQSKPLGFDLMAKEPRKGDRSRRNDDRYLFLEAVLSAREKLYISYVGQSIRDNTVIPPSVLVSELLDTIEQGFGFQDRMLPEYIITKHRLQPFSTEYFKQDGRLFSYSLENFKAAECFSKSRKGLEPFISEGLTEPADEWKTVDIDALCRFFTHPARFLVNKRLGIYLDGGATALQDTEPFEVSGLERYSLAQGLVERRLAGADLKDYFHLTRAAGLLPHGSVGECMYEKLSREVEGFAEKTGNYTLERALAPLEIDLNLSGFRLTGTVGSIYPERMIQYRYAKIKAKDRIRTWIYHLALNRIHPQGYPLASMVAGQDKRWVAWEFAPVEDVDAILAKLLEIYWNGLRKPLHFFPESSWTYAEQVVEKGRPAGDALQKARASWMGGYYPGEMEDLYYRLCFRNRDPLDSEFQETGLDVFGPMVECQKKMKG